MGNQSVDPGKTEVADNSVDELDFSIDQQPTIQIARIGNEQHPVVVVDSLMNAPADMVEYAASGSPFGVENDDFYPGLRKPIPDSYSADLAKTSLYLLQKVFNIDTSSIPEIGICFLSINTTKPQDLLPIQSIPHFDNSDDRQFAVVHYLCEPHLGGTSFYRHRETGYESISNQRSDQYTRTLERQATSVGLPEPGYMSGDSSLFERTASFDAKFNRAIFYRSNMLHSGNIQSQYGLSSDPRVEPAYGHNLADLQVSDGNSVEWNTVGLFAAP